MASKAAGFLIELDGRAVKTPAGGDMILPNESLARLIASEWGLQREFIELETMPATRLAGVALDSTPFARSEIAQRLADYAAHDLICYFAEGPSELARRQDVSWAPLLSWAHDRLGLAFRRASGVTPKDQPPETLVAVEALARQLADFPLTGLITAAQLFGSTVIALALMKDRVTSEEAFAASQLDEQFQAETWGRDSEAAKRTQAMEAEARTLGQ